MQNVLIVKMSALGDITHTLPALTTLRRHLPHARITWLLEDPALDIVRGHRAVDRLLVWRRREWIRLLQAGRLLALAGHVCRFIRELRDTRYDLVIDFQGLLKSAIWVALTRASRKSGYGRGLRHDEYGWIFLSERVPVIDPDSHAVERNLGLLEGLGLARLPLQYDFPILPASQAEADRLLTEGGIAAGTAFVAVNPMTRWPTKNWTTGQFAAVADELIAGGMPVVFTGAPDDRTAIDAIAGAMKHRPVRTDGRTDLKALAAVYRRASVVLSTDTGPMHIAVAVGTPVVALFGPTSPGYTGPHGAGHIVLSAGVTCSPCYRRTCETTVYEKHACMLRLRVEDVVEAVRRKAAEPRTT